MSAASTSRLIVDVLVAMIVSAGQISSSRAIAARLTAMSSNTASTTSCAPAKRLDVERGRKSGQGRLGLGGGELALRDAALQRVRIRSAPACRAASCSSHAVTFSPAAIRAWAMPAPIVPIPSTPASVIRVGRRRLQLGDRGRLPAGTEDVDLVLRGPRGHALAKARLARRAAPPGTNPRRRPGPLPGSSAGRSARAGTAAICVSARASAAWLAAGSAIFSRSQRA